MTAARSLITTADDFGLSSETNTAILRGFDEGAVSHASLLVNLPGFEEACQAARERQLNGRIGLHLNFTEGQPLTERIRNSSFCRDGSFLLPHRYSYYRLFSASDKAAAAEEARAQVALMRSQGLSLAHLDSHHHIHTFPSLLPVVSAIAHDHGINRVRPARTSLLGRSVIRWLFFRYVNGQLRRTGLKKIDCFGSVNDVLSAPDRYGQVGACSVELMLHPRLTPAGTLVDAPSMRPLKEVMEALAKLGFRLETFC
jgi:chitin disaccharide deacetylase